MTAVCPSPLRGLYLITPDGDDSAALLDKILPVLASRPALLQFRNKQLSASAREELAGQLLAACQRQNIPLIINDDWQLAARIAADGAHLGRHDGDFAQAREALGDKALLGISAYNDLARLQLAQEMGANYVGVGAIFPSSSKPAAVVAGLSLLRQACVASRLPVVAIGGIEQNNIAQVLAAGATMAAVINSVFAASDPLVTAQALVDICAGKA